jgi:hypothetical protein
MHWAQFTSKWPISLPPLGAGANNCRTTFFLGAAAVAIVTLILGKGPNMYNTLQNSSNFLFHSPPAAAAPSPSIPEHERQRKRVREQGQRCQMQANKNCKKIINCQNVLSACMSMCTHQRRKIFKLLGRKRMSTTSKSNAHPFQTQ